MPFAGVSQGPKNATLRHAMRGALDAVARMMGDQHAEQARGQPLFFRADRGFLTRKKEKENIKTKNKRCQ